MLAKSKKQFPSVLITECWLCVPCVRISFMGINGTHFCSRVKRDTLWISMGDMSVVVYPLRSIIVFGSGSMANDTQNGFCRSSSQRAVFGFLPFQGNSNPGSCIHGLCFVDNGTFDGRNVRGALCDYNIALCSKIRHPSKYH